MTGGRRSIALLASLLVLGSLAIPFAEAGRTVELGDSVVMGAAAVAETPNGLVGSTATITITAAKNGTGHVFIDTFPLTQVDMQGSARLAARVAAQVTGKALADHDLFYVIRSGSEQIGGPSAGAALAVGSIAALNGWEVRPDVLMTGTINPDGSIGPVGGIPEKAAAAADAGMRKFLFPQGQEISPLQGDPSRGVNMVAYCRDQLAIECVPVSDVREAIGHMTDHVIERPPLRGNVTGEVFRQKLAPLSQDLVDQAARLVGEARGEVERLPRDATRAELAERLANAEATLGRAREATGNGSHYTASSLSFQASIEAHAVRDAARFAREGVSAVGRALDEAADTVADARREIDAVTVTHVGRFESVGAAQDRLMQAEDQLALARTQAAQNTLEGAIEAINTAAFAAERAKTATWWLGLGENVPQGAPVSAEMLEGAARDTLTATQEIVSYVEAVFSSSQSGVALTDAREKLQQARRAMERGYAPGAMMLALEAETRSSALLNAMGYGGSIPDRAFEDAQLRAALAIQEARERGVEPLLAQSVYEFSFAQPNGIDRLAFLGMARVSANLAGLPGLFGESAPVAASRFQGVPEQIGIRAEYVPAAFAVGLAMGAGIGLAALMPRNREEDEEFAPAEAHEDVNEFAFRL